MQFGDICPLVPSPKLTVLFVLETKTTASGAGPEVGVAVRVGDTVVPVLPTVIVTVPMICVADTHPAHELPAVGVQVFCVVLYSVAV